MESGDVDSFIDGPKRTWADNSVSPMDSSLLLKYLSWFEKAKSCNYIFAINFLRCHPGIDFGSFHSLGRI